MLNFTAVSIMHGHLGWMHKAAKFQHLTMLKSRHVQASHGAMLYIKHEHEHSGHEMWFL